MASCAFLRAHIALASGVRYLTASMIEPDLGCSGIGGSASVGIAGVGPRSMRGKAPSSLPTRGGGGSGSGMLPDGSRVGLVGAIDGDGVIFVGTAPGIDGSPPLVLSEPDFIGSTDCFVG